DVFAMIFYLLSRYEEYGDTTKDSHGRFPSHASLAHQHDFLKMPLVDLWIQRLYSDIQDRLSNRRMTPKGRPHSYPSIDIDMPLAFKYKGPRSYLGLFRDIVSGRMDTAQGRMKTWFGGTDPFDTYSQILEFAAERTITWRFFVLLNYQRPFDLNHLAHRPEMKRIVDQLSPKHHVGLHPSYLSHQSTDQLRKEHKGLCDLLQTQIVMSRQHFIKISLPETYRSLVELGIQEDHSMMYPDQCGFRAGTCHPFRWYDLLADHVTDLVIHPYQCMEVTMRYYEKMDVEQAIAEVTQLHQSCQEVGGTFGWIWHNSSLSRAYGWEPWRKVFDHLLVLSAA
ncbi:MAG: polysaccharide deacetylase family protein, partial [Bacteroidota bacterium]